MIGAAQTLIARAADDLSFDEIKADLEAVRAAVQPSESRDDKSPKPEEAELNAA